MSVYQLACLQNDGSWLQHSFQAADDYAAISYGLRARTEQTCKLYGGAFLLAIYDGAEAAAMVHSELELA